MKTILKTSKKAIIKLCTLFVFLLITSICNAQWVQMGERIDGEYGFDRAGNAVDMSADGLTLIIGNRTRRDYANNLNGAGSGRVFKFVSGTWEQQGQDILGKAQREYSGHSVSMSADGLTVAIGAPNNDGPIANFSAGQVRVYKFIGESWIQLGSDITGEKHESLGNSIELSADGLTIAIGGTKVKVYTFREGNWIQLGSELTGGEIIDYPGYEISLSSDGLTAAIGGRDGSKYGQVRILKFIDNDWVQQGTNISDYGGLSGVPVSLNSNGLSIAIGSAVSGYEVLGFASVFEFVNGVWEKKGENIYDETRNTLFGYSVNLSDDGLTLAVGAISGKTSQNESGAGYVKVFKFVSGEWEQKGENLVGRPSDAQGNWGDALGYAVSLSADGNTLIAGARGRDERARGYARMYYFDSNTADVEEKEVKMVRVFPNLTSGEITIQLLTPLASEINIVDVNGRLVYSNSINESLTKINLSNLQNGLYFLSVKNSTGSKVEKIILNK